MVAHLDGNPITTEKEMKKSNVVQLRQPVQTKTVRVQMDLDTYQALMFLGSLDDQTVPKYMSEAAKQMAMFCPHDRAGYLRSLGMVV